MKRIITILFIVVISVSCSVRPEPLRFSVDNCHFCKMTLADDKFGGELVTKKGKVFKFDDIKCMVAFLNTSEGNNQYEYELVVDYAHDADEFDLIPASDAFYLQSPEVKSPMNGEVASFHNKLERDDFQKKWNGTSLSWNQIKKALR
jgi:copper chaperone NosL